MKILRFILPFLFVRNWYDGSWELSKPRLTFFVGGLAILLIGLIIAYLMQSPVPYIAAFNSF